MAEILHQSINFDIACSITVPQCRCEKSLFEFFFFWVGGGGGGGGMDVTLVKLFYKLKRLHMGDLVARVNCIII